MALTPETFKNLERDIEDTGKAVNTDSIINPRYGAPFNSFPRAVRLMMETGGWNFYSTESELLATVPEVVPSVAYAADTKKLY
ncbi:TPA: exo-alpha-sialidase, partial [Acinetobacter baumannii]|nr:exo-alpha-sialidase [Acinetobacter baumannii]